jgi:hypothetical protein
MTNANQLQTENKKLLLEILEDLNLYIEHFIGTKNLELIRSKLRLLHQKLEKGNLKSQVRGALTYLNRWPLKKVWLRLSTIIQMFTTHNQIKTLYKRRILENNRFIGHGAVLTILKNQTPLAIKME